MKKLIAVLFVCLAMIAPAAMAQTPEPAVSIEQPMLPDFACTDTAYADAVADGITLGITPDFPYTYLDESNEPAAGQCLTAARGGGKVIPPSP